MLAIAATSASGATLSPPHPMPGGARRMTWDGPSQTLVCAMALHGTTFIRMADTAIVDESWHPQWTTLHVIALGGGRYLLADRSGVLRLVERDAATTDFAEVAAWPCDGVPTHLVWREGVLHVAAGGAGVLVFDWDGTSTKPRLRARFPFVDFSKEIAFLGPTTFAVADNQETGYQLISLTDIQRPRLLARESHSFVDGVSTYGNRMAITARGLGTLVFDVAEPTTPRLAATVPLRGNTPLPTARFCAFSPEGRLLVCHDGEGAVLKTLDENGQELDLIDRLSVVVENESFLSAAFLPGGVIALSSMTGNLYFAEP